MLLLLHALIPCLAAYTLPLFFYFLVLSIPTSFNILMEMFLHLFFCYLLLQIQCSLRRVCEPRPFCSLVHGHMKRT